MLGAADGGELPNLVFWRPFRIHDRLPEFDLPSQLLCQPWCQNKCRILLREYIERDTEALNMQ